MQETKTIKEQPVRIICTKPGNMVRFEWPYVNLVPVAVLRNNATLYYLAEHSTLANEARAVCELEYDAGFDIDRFCIFTHGGIIAFFKSKFGKGKERV